MLGETGKTHMNKVEFDSLLRIYGKETFFTLFSGDTKVYE